MVLMVIMDMTLVLMETNGLVGNGFCWWVLRMETTLNTDPLYFLN